MSGRLPLFLASFFEKGVALNWRQDLNGNLYKSERPSHKTTTPLPSPFASLATLELKRHRPQQQPGEPRSDQYPSNRRSQHTNLFLPSTAFIQCIIAPEFAVPITTDYRKVIARTFPRRRSISPSAAPVLRPEAS